MQQTLLKGTPSLMINLCVVIKKPTPFSLWCESVTLYMLCSACEVCRHIADLKSL